MRHMSHVTRQKKRKKKIYIFIYIFIYLLIFWDKMVELVVGGSVINKGDPSSFFTVGRSASFFRPGFNSHIGKRAKCYVKK